MSIVFAIMTSAPPEVALTAINSARDYVDSAVVMVAPGSPLILDPGWASLAALPVQLVVEPWQGYGKTRTRLMRRAEEIPGVEWVLMFDSYSTIHGRLPVLKPHVDSYVIDVETRFAGGGRWRWSRAGHLLRAHRGFSWLGSGDANDTHEALVVPEGRVSESCHSLVLDTRSSPKLDQDGRTYLKDAQMLEEALRQDPTNTRAAFYYAQSLKDVPMYPEAYAAFLARARMPGGFVEETFWAMLWAAKIAPFVDVPFSEVVQRHWEAHEFAPDRAEPLHEAALVHARLGYYEQARRFAAAAATKPYPIHARLFVDLGAYSPDALTAAGIEPDVLPQEIA